MTESELKAIFERALTIAAENAEKQLDRPVPRSFEIELHGLSTTSRTITKDQALREIYIGPERLYRIIDVSVVRVSRDVCTVFMRVSGHTPGSWDETWNQPPGSGPFKQLVASEIISID